MGRYKSSSSGGRYKPKTVDFSTAEGLAAYAKGIGLDEQVNKILDTTPKLSFLQRLGKGLGAFNPAEAILTGTEQGVGAGLLKYGTGIVKGIGSAVIGKDIEGERRYFSDVAEKYGIENGIAKFGIGFLGDILLDPTTYFGGAIARGIGLTAKTTGKVAVKGLAKVAPDTATALRGVGESLSDAFGSLFKAGYKTQQGVVGDVMEVMGKKASAVKGLAESNLGRLGTGILTAEQNAEVFARLAGGKRLEYQVRGLGEVMEEGLEKLGITTTKKVTPKIAGEIALEQTARGAKGIVKETIEKQAKRVAKFGEELTGDEFYRSYYPFLKKESLNSLIVNTRGLRVGSEGYLKQFKNILTDENMEKNVAKAFFTRESQVVTDRITRDFLGGFVKKYGKGLDSFTGVDDARRAGFELLREKGIWGKELGYIPKWDMKFITDMFSPEFKSIDMIAKATGFDAVTSLFKRSVTGLFAPFHIRNYVSGNIQNFEVLGAGALNPKNIVTGQKLAYNTAKNIKAKGEFGKILEPFMNRFGFSSFYKNEFDNALNAGQTLGQYEKMFSKGVLIKTIKTAGLSSESIPFRMARSVGNYIELQQKGTAYITALGQGKSIKAALELAERAGFDYRVLTKFESQIMRRIIPFYSFTRKNIELQLRTLGTHPERINQIIRLVENVGTDRETEGLPDYVKEGFAIKLPDSASGLKQYITSLGTPIEQFAGLFKQNNVLNIISQTNPILKVPIELGIGKDSFRQKDLKNVYDAKEYKFAPQIIKDLLLLKPVEKPTYKKVGDKLIKTGTRTQYVADPERLLIARSLFTSRGVTYLDQIFNNDMVGFTKFLKLFTGLKPQEFDLELGKSLKENEQKRALEDLILKYSDIKKFQKLYETK